MEKVKIKIDGIKKEMNLEDNDAALIITLQELTYFLEQLNHKMERWVT